MLASSAAIYNRVPGSGNMPFDSPYGSHPRSRTRLERPSPNRICRPDDVEAALQRMPTKPSTQWLKMPPEWLSRCTLPRRAEHRLHTNLSLPLAKVERPRRGIYIAMYPGSPRWLGSPGHHLGRGFFNSAAMQRLTLSCRVLQRIVMGFSLPIIGPPKRTRSPG